jgi:hypothetical protein
MSDQFGKKQAMKPASNLSPETIQDLERCCTDLIAVYRRAMAAATSIEKDWRQLMRYRRGHRTEEDRIQEEAYKRNRAKFRSKANLYRRQAETVLNVLEWAAPDKHRALNGTQWMPLRPLTKEVDKQQRQIRDISARPRDLDNPEQ